MTTDISTVDLIIVVVYIGCIFAVGIYAYIVARNEKTKNKAEQYFLASRDTTWIPVAFTIFSSNIGAEHFIGLAGTGAKDGIAVGMFEWSAPFALFMMAYFVSEIYLSSNIVTTPEYLEMRFNRNIRIYNALIMLFIFIFTVISATLYAGSVILQTIFGWNMWVSSIILISITGIYVILGGLRAVIYTENVQAVILLSGGILVGIMAMYEVGGWSGIKDYYDSQNMSKNLHMARPVTDPDWPWPGVYITIPLQGYFYWTCNQMLVQRVLSAKSQLHSKYGAIMAATIKILPVFMMIIPGMISTVLYKEYFDGDYDKAYPVLVTHLLPKGLIGFVIASMLSALMSSLASVYNSASTIITNDVYKLIFPNVSDDRLVQIGRISSCIFILVSVLWLPIIQQDSDMQLYNYINEIYAYIQNPISVVFFFGHFWKRGNVWGAYATVAVGTSLGIYRFVFGFLLNNWRCDNWFCECNYLYFGLFNLGVSAAVMIIVSLLTPKPKPEQINGYVYGTKLPKKITESSSLLKHGDKDIDDESPIMAVNDPRDIDVTASINNSDPTSSSDEDDESNNCCKKCINLSGNKRKYKIIVNIWTCLTSLSLLCLYIIYF